MRDPNQLNAFLLLRMIRDGEITNVHQFLASLQGPNVVPSLEGYVLELLWSLERLRFIKIEPKVDFDEIWQMTADSTIRVTETAHLFTATFEVSLTEMSVFGKQSVVANPIFGRPERKQSYPDVFVLMPFKDELSLVYQDHIKSVATTLGLSAARADDFFSSGSIMRDVWEAIHGAKAVVADCTGRNPNVFYEIGIAHTIGKRVVLTAQSVEDIPFDLRHLRTIVYNYTPRGMQNFEKALLETLRNEINDLKS